MEQDARWAARYFPPRTVLQLHKFEAQEKLMHYKNARKLEEKKAFIHLRPVLKETRLILYFCDSWPVFVFSALCDLASEIFHFFQKQFSKNNIFCNF